MVFAILVAAALGAPRVAHALGGSGMLRGPARFTVQRCPGLHDRVDIAVALASDGTWTAVANDVSYEGTWTADSTGRRYQLFFSTRSELGFVGTLASDASELCRTSIMVTSVTRGVFSITLNRRRTKARLLLRYAATGMGNGRAGAARYRLTLHGRWTAF